MLVLAGLVFFIDPGRGLISLWAKWITPGSIPIVYTKVLIVPTLRIRRLAEIFDAMDCLLLLLRP